MSFDSIHFVVKFRQMCSWKENIYR